MKHLVMKLCPKTLGIFCSCLFFTACTNSNTSVDQLTQDKFIQVYFNHRQTEPQTFTDPYRNIERSGDDLETVIVDSITAAQSSIELAVQELNSPRIALALASRHLSGVEVKVILDNNYSRSWADLNSVEADRLSKRDRHKYEQFLQLVDVDRNGKLSQTEIAQRDTISILQQAGIPIIDDRADGSKGSGLMHHKFMVVDRQIVVTGSANFTLSGLVGDINNSKTRGNVNHLLRIDNTQVASLFSAEFGYMWGNPALGIPNQFGLAKPWRSPQTISWQDTAMTIQFAPTSQKQPWSHSTNGLIAKTLNEANKSVDLALFVFSEQELANVLQQKYQSGIKIRGVFDSGFAYRYYSEVLDLLGRFSYFRCQIEDGNSPWVNPLDTVGTAYLNSGDKLHHKFTVIDNKTIISGSQNWSQAANQINDEAVIIMRNLTVSQHFMREFERLYSSVLLEMPLKAKQKIDLQFKKCS
ncbi:MAG: phospholipase D-like domain-containing protein [Cyanobacteria bacterium J06600_6]